ncbi:MAG: hypothetical protein GX154_05955 [Clostridiales bacterium]|nr:hypothetical protein [Clostridiales bacterium]
MCHKYRNINTGQIINARDEALEILKEAWAKQKALENRSGFNEFIKPSETELIEYGCVYFDEDEEWEKI